MTKVKPKDPFPSLLLTLEEVEPTVSGDVTTNSSNGTEPSVYYDVIELYLVSAILACLAVIGTAGNAIVIYVFKSKKDNAVSTFFILTLAFVDFATCLVIIPYTIFMENVRFEVQWDVVCKFYQFLITSNIPFSALIMVAIAIDRYFCICHPFKRVVTVSRARILVVVMATLAAAIGVCVSMMYGVYGNAPEDAPHGDHSNEAISNPAKSLTRFAYLSETNFSAHDTTSKWTNSVVVLLVPGSTRPPTALLVNTGQCAERDDLVSGQFRMAFQKLYAAVYLSCFITVVVLYVLIYRSVLERRARRLRQKSAHLPLVPGPDRSSGPRGHHNRTPPLAKTYVPNPEDTDDSPSRGRPLSRQTVEPQSPLPAQRPAARLANLKTAGVLFVVTLVFIVTFLPALLMAHGLIPYSMTVFYMYFANNVANPVIYSFMNRNFRQKMKWLICRR